LKQLLSEKDDDYKRYNVNYDNQKRSLELELKKAYDEIRDMRGHQLAYEQLCREHAKVKDECEILQNKVKLLTPLDRDELPQAFQTNPDLHKKVELLSADKDYLGRENIKLTEMNKRLENKNDDLTAELAESKRTVQKYLQDLLDARQNTSLSYEKRLNDDLAALREKNARELEFTKNNLTEIYEKQIRFLKEQKEDLEFKVETLTAQLRDKQTQYEDILREGKDFGNKYENELSELRIGNRIKTEELERLRIDIEDRNAEIRALKGQCEMHKDKIAILRAEFFKAEAKSKEDNSELKAKNLVLEEKLKNYENIENDIDQAVLGFGTTRPDAQDNIYLGSIGMAPTSTQRRVQQSISLAQKLNEKQNEVNKLRVGLKDKENDLQRCKDELFMTQELLQKTKHPSAYLIENLEGKEKENLNLKQALLKANNEVDFLKQENSDLQNVDGC
jgi:chromosome segregation ATPase